MKALKFNLERLGSLRDAIEIMITTEYKDKEYKGFIDITGIREALEAHKGGIKPLIYKARKQFEEGIIKGKINPSDRIKYCF